MKVFVTGATGYLGTHITRLLLTRGHSVTALARSPSSIAKLQSLGVTPLPGSLSDLSTLTAAARDHDAVIHTAFDHDFLNPSYDMMAVAAQDRAALHAMADGVRGTDKPIVAANGLVGGVPGKVLLETDEKLPGPRTPIEGYFKELGKEGIRAITIRCGPSIHGEGDTAFIPTLIAGARKHGYAICVDEEAKWTGVHVKDAAMLFVLAAERGAGLPGGTVLHAAEDGAVGTGEIAEVIGRKVGVPVKKVSVEEAIGMYGFIGRAFGMGIVGDNEVTKGLTGWEVREKGLLADLEEGTYF